jgi:hypothetical protein
MPGISLIILAGILFTVFLQWSKYQRLRFHLPGPTALDSIMLRLLEVAYWTEWCRDENRWAHRRHTIALMSEIERISREAQKFATRRVAFWDLKSRREARRKGMQLASLIRGHKHALAAATGPEDFHSVTRSLTAGLVAWSEQDIKAILSAAPEITLRDWLRPALRRIWPATILAGLAGFLPQLSVFNGAPQAAQSIRAALFIAAGVALTSGGAGVPERISAIVDKSFEASVKEKSGDRTDKK